VSRILFDSSALYKRYNRELGRELVLSFFERARVVVVAAHGLTEIASAFHRQRHDGLLSDQDYDVMMQRVQRDFSEFEVMSLDRRVEAFAIAAMRRARLRAMDALHVGTAMAAGIDLFVTADRRQADAAKSVGVVTEWIGA
jgi:uncharacterized protein